MQRQDAERRLVELNSWTRGAERAPHKPLLILYALGQLLNAGKHWLPFSEVQEPLCQLLIMFGPQRKSLHPEYPFWRLQRDGVWVVRLDGQIRPRQSNSDPPKSELLRCNAEGGFSTDLAVEISRDAAWGHSLAKIVLDRNFPTSVHEDILGAVGLDEEVTLARRRRDSSFRERVLTAYEYRCAVCGLDIRLGQAQVGIDAAHVKWHQAGGPDIVENGLALCTLHHKLFDRGAFTVDTGYRVCLSQHARGSEGFDQVLRRYHGELIRMPLEAAAAPMAIYLHWHAKEVFRGPGRP